MASRGKYRLPQGPLAMIRERSDTDPDPDDRYHRGRKVRPAPSRHNRLQRTRSPSRSSQVTEHDEIEIGNDQDSSRSRSSSPAQVKYRPSFTIDWRRELCRFLRISNQISDDEILEALAETEEKLKDAERLKYEYTADPGPPRSQVLHRIHCHEEAIPMLYQEEPWPVESGPYHAHLRGSKPIRNLELFRAENKNISFLVFRQYHCCRRHQTKWQHTTKTEHPTAAELSLFFNREYIDLVSPQSRTALTILAGLALDGIPHPLSDGENDGSISHPYLWWFHRRDEIAAAKAQMDPTLQQHVDLVQAYIEDRLLLEWKTVDDLIEKGKITVGLLRYIFVPNEILISQVKGEEVSQLNGLEALNWLSIDPVSNETTNFRSSIPVKFWEFDGSFRSKTARVALDDIPVQGWTESFDIVELSIYPARFAVKCVIQGLRNRGEMFWACRHQKYVSYAKNTHDDVQSVSTSRFMVDLEIYKKMHPPTQLQQDQRPSRELQSQSDNLLVDMTNEKPPTEDSFLMCLPPTMKGFDMNTKAWKTLEVAFMREVVWNYEAFEDLVIKPETKDLVKAVVMNRLVSDEQTDLIQGKGNGLFILLHGGPGTGKTLTAESMAEIANKPLYKVTCGDVGTKPEEVEEYLKVVTLLGKTWGCVVLLDEADIFLEQRSLANLKRNALVSVFLRVLEYYDGIMILTTNRVGTFDEAFKSRIQLNLHYENLDQKGRRKIWTNFITRLELKMKVADDTSHCYGIDSESIRDNLENLANENLNGREIRNAISTARQLSLYKREALNYDHLMMVVNEAKKFESYLVTLHDGHSADQIQHDLGAR